VADRLEATFMLMGPDDLWDAVWWRLDEPSDRAALRVAEFTIDGRPLTVSWDAESPVPSRSSASVMSMTVRDAEQPWTGDDDEFAKAATELVEDVLTLMSLLNRGRIHWFQCESSTRVGKSVRIVRGNVRGHEPYQLHHEHPPISPDNVRGFLESGILALRRRRIEGHPSNWRLRTGLRAPKSAP
jgi:hypothetical protein